MLIIKDLVKISLYLILASCNISILWLFVKFSNWYSGDICRLNQDHILAIKVYCSHTSSTIFGNTNVQNKWNCIIDRIANVELNLQQVHGSAVANQGHIHNEFYFQVLEPTKAF